MANLEACLQAGRLRLPFLKPPVSENGLRRIHGMIQHLVNTKGDLFLRRPSEGLPSYPWYALESENEYGNERNANKETERHKGNKEVILHRNDKDR